MAPSCARSDGEVTLSARLVANELLAEEVGDMGVVLETLHLLVAAGPVEAERLDQLLVDAEDHAPGTQRASAVLQVLEEEPAQPAPADVRLEPHPLDLDDARLDDVDRAETDGLAGGDLADDAEVTARRGDLGRVGRVAERGVAGQPGAELGAIGAHGVGRRPATRLPLEDPHRR